MQKILFNDKYGLTEAVLSGRKTQTRRIIPNCTGFRQSPFSPSGFVDNHGNPLKPKYNIGEVIAIGQCYRDVGIEPTTIIPMSVKGSKTGGIMQCEAKYAPGWTNKMFVKPEMMKHFIKITGIRIGHLQGISTEDAIQEGFSELTVNNNWGNSAEHTEYHLDYLDGHGCYKTIGGPDAQESYGLLIDKLSGRGVWESDPVCWIYEFELVK